MYTKRYFCSFLLVFQLGAMELAVEEKKKKFHKTSALDLQRFAAWNIFKLKVANLLKRTAKFKARYESRLREAEGILKKSYRKVIFYSPANAKRFAQLITRLRTCRYHLEAGVYDSYVDDILHSTPGFSVALLQDIVFSSQERLYLKLLQELEAICDQIDEIIAKLVALDKEKKVRRPYFTRVR